jgi:hypothetical protein
VLGCSGGRLSGCGRVTGGFPFFGDGCSVDDRLASVVASAVAARVHATTQVGQPGVEDVVTVGTSTPSDVMPTPREVARQLARFTEEV